MESEKQWINKFFQSKEESRKAVVSPIFTHTSCVGRWYPNSICAYTKHFVIISPVLCSTQWCTILATFINIIFVKLLRLTSLACDTVVLCVSHRGTNMYAHTLYWSYLTTLKDMLTMAISLPRNECNSKAVSAKRVTCTSWLISHFNHSHVQVGAPWHHGIHCFHCLDCHGNMSRCCHAKRSSGIVFCHLLATPRQVLFPVSLVVSCFFLCLSHWAYL